MAAEQKIDEHDDQFPVGMRVLAVDDNPTCLMVLETLLRKCKYHVTTTSEAVTALKILRENKNMFDLVISDVHMPDMDGFKLLELMGLEMDLPVIMLSAYGDTKLVMKGITHGACDYLLKPVRIEELKNIWQHVIRRKKCDTKEQNFFDKPYGESGERGEGLTASGDCDQNGKLNRKRKDQNVDEDEQNENENEENGHDSEDPSSQKKPRVVWSVELHKKFVAAVNELGIDKAMPKRILELMNVEKLTRENVASHLQKYRLYLKRISCVASQQATMVAAFGNVSSASMRMGSLNGLENFRTVSGSGQFQNSALRSFPSGSVLGRLNTPAGLCMHGLSPSGIKPLGVAQNTSNPVNDQANFPSVQSGNQNGHILQGIPMSLELEQMRHNKNVTQTGEFAVSTNDSLVYPISSFSDMKLNINNSSTSLLGTANDSITLLGHYQGNQWQRGFGDQSSVTDISVQRIPSHLSDTDRCTDNWASAVQSTGFKSDYYSGSNCFKQNNTSELMNNVSPMAVNTVTNLQDVSSLSSLSPQLLDMRNDFKTQTTSISSDSEQNMSSRPKQGWDDNSQNIYFHSNFICSSMNSSVSPHSSGGPFYQRLDPKNLNCQIADDFNSIGLHNCTNPLEDVVENSTMGMGLKLKQGYVGERMKEHGSYANNNPGSFENILNALMKQEQESLVKEADLLCDAYSHCHGTSILW